MRAKYDVDVELIFAVKKIYQQFESNDFYQFCAKELNINIINCQLPNKFDYRNSKLNEHLIGRLLIRYYFRLLLIIKIPFIINKLFKADAYMHETSNQRMSTFLLHLSNRLLKKTIFMNI